MRSTHIIHRLNLQIAVTNEEDGRYWLNESSANLQQLWLPKVEQLFDKYAQTNSQIRIEQLFIKVSASNSEDWMDLALKDLAQQLNDLLEKNSRQEEEQNLSETQHILELFFFYLQYGRLPWFARASDNLESSAIISALMDDEIKGKQLLTDLLHKKVWIRYRLARQMETPLLQYLASLLLPLELYKKINRLLGNEQKSWRILWTRMNPALLSEATAQKELLEQLADTTEPFEPSEPETQQDEQEQAIYLSHAGLVLLHPFLPQLFQTFGWLKDNEFVDLPTQETAVYLLHFIAGGAEQAMEYQMVFEKYLCGLPLDYPIQQRDLKQEMKKETEEMLQSVIAHWLALRNTSIAGLQEGFLQRDGKLDLEAGKLLIERTGVDILLDHLPWGVDIIRLPWLPQLIQVSW